MGKKKNVDFQKTKLKVGKKVAKRSNETSTQFKSKRIVLKESTVSESNQMVVLSRNLSSNKQFKLTCLNKIYNGYLENNAVDGEAINTLSRLLIDNDEQVRQAAIRCLKKSISKMINDDQSITPFFTILLTYIKCGLTHIADSTVADSRDMLAFIVEKCDVTSHHQLMLSFLPRLTVDSQIIAQDFELAEKIVRCVSKPVQQIEKRHHHQSFVWNPKENFYDLSQLTVRQPNFNQNLSFQLNAEEDIRGNFLSCITKLVDKELADLEKRKVTQLRIDRSEARKLIACVRIADVLGIKWENLKDKLRTISITDELIDNKSAKKVQTETNQLVNSLKSLLR